MLGKQPIEGLPLVDDFYPGDHLTQFVGTHALTSYPSSYHLLTALRQKDQPQQIGLAIPQVRHLIAVLGQLILSNPLLDLQLHQRLIQFVRGHHLPLNL